MTRWISISTLLAVLLFSQWAEASVVYWDPASGGNGHYYEFVAQWVSWPDAFAAAKASSYQGMPGHLVTITSLAENAFVAKLTNGGFTWIGLTDSEDYGGSESISQPNPQTDGWVWVTGEPVVFTNWRSGEPNNHGGNEDFAGMNADGLHSEGISFWNDGSGDSSHYVIEYEPASAPIPEPTTLIIWLGLSSIGLIAARRRRRVA